MSASTLSIDKSFMTIAESFVCAIRRGEQPSISSVVAQYPEFESDIRNEFPTLVFAETLKSISKSEYEQPAVLRRIGKYRIDRELGQGGMGVVYAGYDESSGEDVAVKVMSLNGLSRRDGIKRFRREAQAAGKMKHPNIVSVYDYGVLDEVVYLVMKRIHGLDLSQIIDQLSLERETSGSDSVIIDWAMLVKAGAEIASAISYAHDRGMIHRDIKPANLLMDCDGRVWVTDFGLVKTRQFEQGLSQTGDLIGTPRYMAPEQLRGICDTRSDIYGIGISLYEFATGRKAWENVRQNELTQIRQSLELPHVNQLNPEVPRAIGDIIMKCCASNPDDRYQTAKEVEFVLNRYLNGCNIPDRRKNRQSKRTVIDRRPILAIRTAVCVAALTAMSGWFYSDFRHIRHQYSSSLVDNPHLASTGQTILTRLNTLNAESMAPENSTSSSTSTRTVDEWIAAYEGRKASTGRLDLVNTDTPLSIAMRFNPISDSVDHGNFSPDEKKKLRLSLKKLTQSILEKHISQQSLAKLLDLLEELLNNEVQSARSSNKSNAPKYLSPDSVRIMIRFIDAEVAPKDFSWRLDYATPVHLPASPSPIYTKVPTNRPK